MFRSTHPKHVLVAMTLVILSAVLAGCGSGEHAAVEGAVTLDGQPVDGGVIIFFPVADSQGQANRVPASTEIKNGRYAMDSSHGPAVGKCRVEIHWNKKTGKQIPSGDPPNKVDETVQVIPTIYNKRTILTPEIKAGANTFNYELKSPK
jgi:hypothetical protein